MLHPLNFPKKTIPISPILFWLYTILRSILSQSVSLTKSTGLQQWRNLVLVKTIIELGWNLNLGEFCYCSPLIAQPKAHLFLDSFVITALIKHYPSHKPYTSVMAEQTWRYTMEQTAVDSCFQAHRSRGICPSSPQPSASYSAFWPPSCPAGR